MCFKEWFPVIFAFAIGHASCCGQEECEGHKNS